MRGDEPLKHISRPSLPWRAADLTRCGRPIAELREDRIVTWAEAKAVVEKHGKKRAAFMFCMVCADGTRGWVEWDNDPIALLTRELESVGGVYRSWARDRERERRALVETELRVAAMLIERHRAEFDAAVQAHESGDVVDLSNRRRRSS